MRRLHLFDLPPEILICIVDLLLPFDIIPALHAENRLATYIIPRLALVQDKDGNTVLHHLACDGQDSLIKQFLSRKVNCSITNDAGLTPLILAIRGKHANVVKLLLQAGADVSTVYPNGHTIMLNMKDCLNARIVKLLIRAGADISPCDRNGEPVLVHAIRARKVAVARVLIEAGADVNLQLREGSAWILAVLQGDKKMVQLLINAGADTKARWEGGRTPLEIAAWRNYYQILRILLAAGFAVSAQCDRGVTALHGAAERGHEAAVRLLLDSGADVHSVQSNRSSVLHSAVRSGSTSIIRMLLDAGADLSACDNGGQTVLQRAIQALSNSPALMPLIKLLINSGIDLSAKDLHGRTALHQAASQGMHRVVKYLIEAGADSSALCIYNQTALHYAAMFRGSRGAETVRVLLDAGVDPSVQSTKGSTALHLVIESRQHRTLLYLLDSPIDVSAIDNTGRTALHYAAQRGWKEGVQALLPTGIDVSIRASEGWTAQALAARAHFYSIAKAIEDVAKADRSILSQTCLWFSIHGQQVGVPQPASDHSLRHLHTKCHRAGSFHSLLDVIEDMCALGDMERIKPLCEAWMAEMLRTHPPGETSSLQNAVVAAAKNQHVPVVAYLLSLGVPISHMLIKGVIDGGSTELFQVLLEHGWDINAQYEEGRSSLMLCLGNESLVNWHLEHGADTSLRNTYRYNVLEIAALSGDLPMVKRLIEHGMDPRNSRALIAATGKGSYQMGCHLPSGNRLSLMEYLLDVHGVGINAVEEPYRRFDHVQCERGTVLHAAIEAGCPVQVEFLLRRGVDRNVGNPLPLEYASRMRRWDAVDILLNTNG
ncbi:hypothetical protein GX51_01433 [Blastomyces parvus]|uniref:Uncharacterized protein n=1 Tax=Blastomyces parvus TaxID=2060905 RepID=A0A2B7XGV1_9EURO|nr:hypothetical protein GX51_01433 [Blastomyces parvus]